MEEQGQQALVSYTARRKEFGDAQPVFHVRPDTSDPKSVDEVFKNNSYRKKHFTIEPGERWVDMGANIGAFSVLAVRLGADLKASYEADATNVGLAAHNIEINGAMPRVIHAAIVPDSHRGDTITLHTNSEPLSLRRHSILKARKKSTPVQVRAVRFSDAVREAGADCIKMNIEGAEIPILAEASGFAGLRKLVFEWSFDVERSIPKFKAMLDKLKLQFNDVQLSKGNIPWGLPTYDFFPPNVFVYAMRR